MIQVKQIKDMNGVLVNAGDILHQVKNYYGMIDFHYHVCFDDGYYGIEIRDLGANNVGMCEPEHECVNLGHITKCYKTLPINKCKQGIWGSDEWMYYFKIWPYKKEDEDRYDSYGIKDLPPEELTRIHDLNNFPKGWELPEEDKL